MKIAMEATGVRSEEQAEKQYSNRSKSESARETKRTEHGAEQDMETELYEEDGGCNFTRIVMSHSSCNVLQFVALNIEIKRGEMALVWCVSDTVHFRRDAYGMWSSEKPSTYDICGIYN